MEPTESKQTLMKRIGVPNRSSNPTTKLAFAILTVIFFATLFGYMKLVLDIRNLSHESIHLTEKYIVLTKENKRVIAEIQKNRLTSCQKTYEGIHDVVRIAFLGERPLTEEQKKFSIHFNMIISDLKKKCKTQIQ